MINHKTHFITHTAIYISLLVVLQAATTPFGNTLITGSIVNMMLIISIMTCGLLSGVSVAIISPIIAKFFGIGPLWSLIPFISLGNLALILVWYFIAYKRSNNKNISYIAALITGAILKFLVLFVSIVKIAIPYLLELPEKQAVVISNLFSIPQFFTALIGGLFAVSLLPTLKKAMQRG